MADGDCVCVNNAGEVTGLIPCERVTKRELAAMLAMQGYVSQGDYINSDDIATWAVADADALLAELAKGGEG